jgi:hypothetical protein
MTMEEWAEAQAEKRIQAEIDAINESRAAYEAEMQRNYQNRIKAAQDLANFIQAQGIDSRIRGVYSAAANDLAGIAGGFAGETRAVAAADAAAQRNMLSGTGQEGAVRDQGVNMGDVTYGVGGWIPSKSLGEQGAAYAANAALQPAFTLQYGVQDARQILEEGQGGLKDFALAIAEARAGKPKIAQELLAERSEALGDQYNRKLDMLKFRQDQLDERRDYLLKREALGFDVHKELAQLKLDQAKEDRYAMATLGLASDGKTPLAGYYRDAKGRITPKGYKYSKNNVLVKAPSAGGGSGGSGGKGDEKYTPGQRQELLEAIDRKKPDIAKDAAGRIKARFGDKMGPFRNEKKIKNQIKSALFKEYKWMAPTAEAKRLLRRVIEWAVSGGGFSDPEGDGSGSGSGGSGGSSGSGGSGSDGIPGYEN